MAEVQITARLQGETVEDNTILLQMLVSFVTTFQKTVDQVAFVLEGDSGRDQNAIKKETALRIAALQPGSFTPVMLPALGSAEGSLVVRSLQTLIAGLIQLRERDAEIPEGYDQGVLTLLSKVGNVFRKGISAIEFNLRTPQTERTVIYDYSVFTRVKDLIEEAEEEAVALEGHLLGVNFKETRAEEFKLYLYLPDDTRIGCNFDENMAEEVRRALRHFVHIIGRAKLDNVTKKVVSISIKQLTILDLPERPTEEALKAAFYQYKDDHNTVAHFREAWFEAMTGKTHPISELWDDIDAE